VGWPFFRGDEPIKLTIQTIPEFHRKRALHLTSTQCTRQCPTGTPAIPTPIDTLGANFRGGGADPEFCHFHAPWLTATFLEFPTVELCHEYLLSGKVVFVDRYRCTPNELV
jgi:hypothetical protein